MEYIFAKILNKTQKEQIRNLWNREYPVNIAHHNLQDFESYLDNLSDQRHVLIADHYKIVKGWYFDFLREHERWFAMIIDTEIQGKGYGNSLLREAKKNNAALNGWVVNASDYKKENGTTYQPPADFYIRNGFRVFPDIKLETDKLKAIKIKWKK